ncbi:MAG TPA: chloride channel protein [Bacteroidales bacterium]|nr:chloride channel protein [Bacteroidales bacterium]
MQIFRKGFIWKRVIETGSGFINFLTRFLRKTWRNEKVTDAIIRWLPYIIGSILTASVAVLYSKLFDEASSISHHVKANFPWLFFIITPAAFLLSWWIVWKFSKAAGGSGIPQLMAAINPKRENEKVSTGFLLGGKTLVTKIVSSFVALLGGAVIGREGPTIQISGSVFYITHKFFPKVRDRVDRDTMLIAGGAAGLAAAFNTPLGGIVFAIEELSRSHLNVFKSSLLYAVIFSGMTVQWLLGPYLFLGYPRADAGGFSLLGYTLIFSAIAGFAGGLNGRLIYWLTEFTKRIKRVFVYVLYVGLSGLALAFIIYVNENSAFGPGKDVMNAILFNGKEGHISIFLFFSRFFGMIISYATGIAGGIFAPTLSSGSILGQLLMNLFHLDPGNKVLILVAMIGMLTGITRAPFTSAILVLEMTDRHSAIFLFILAGLVSAVTARLADPKPLYSRLEENYLRPSGP